MKRCRVAIHTLQKKDNVLKSIETRCVRPAACKWDSLKDGRCFCPCGEKCSGYQENLKK